MTDFCRCRCCQHLSSVDVRQDGEIDFDGDTIEISYICTCGTCGGKWKRVEQFEMVNFWNCPLD